MSGQKIILITVAVLVLLASYVGTIHPEPVDEAPDVVLPSSAEEEIQVPWWERTSRDLDRNGITDHLDQMLVPHNVGVSYSRDVTETDISALESLGVQKTLRMDIIDAVLIGMANHDLVQAVAALDGVVMVESYGGVHIDGDIQTPAVKARPSAEYPVGAWNHSVDGSGVNIAVVDTGIDDGHPGLEGKFVAGYDAVCSDDPSCVLQGQPDDGTFNPDDQNQHGTACSGMAAATGLEADGSQSEFYGAAPGASLVDVRIGTAVGAGPFENYALEQEFYESAMDGLRWTIEHRDAEWQGADEANYGVDIISLSWGITSHEGGGSDGTDMHSRVLDEATDAGIVVSVAAGNDGPNNDGLSGMGSSSLSITVGALDDMNTVNRDDDVVAGYSSRGPRRDNGDDNPYNELKPEISAPGTNIIQAEACTWSIGQCYGDADGRSYSSRGSGTSYATPSVSGIIAMMLEANPDLDPLMVKEILKITAEPVDPPTYPELDPKWNRDYGWGMVDAEAAVKMSFDVGDGGSTDPVALLTKTQIRNITNVSKAEVMASGITWSQVDESNATESIAEVHWRVNDGSWNRANFPVDTGDELCSANFSCWQASIPTSEVETGLNVLRVRAITHDGNEGLWSEGTFYSTHVPIEEDGNFLGAILIGASIGLILILVALAGIVYGPRIWGDEGSKKKRPDPVDSNSEVAEPDVLAEDA